MTPHSGLRRMVISLSHTYMKNSLCYVYNVLLEYSENDIIPVVYKNN